jgi:hypothetical protein
VFIGGQNEIAEDREILETKRSFQKSTVHRNRTKNSAVSKAKQLESSPGS